MKAPITALIAASVCMLATGALAQSTKPGGTPGPGKSEYAPGQKQTTPGSAKEFAPGQKQTTPGTAKDYAPGQQPTMPKKTK